MIEQKKYCVYSLNEPGTEIVRYIGISGKVNQRFKEHCRKTNLNTKKSCWIKSLKNNGLLPSLSIIEDGLELEEVKKKEVHYILMFKSFGARLVNGTGGGDGMFNASKEVRAKIGAAHKGKKLSKEQIEFLVSINTGRKQSQKCKDAVRLAHTGKIVSESTRKKHSERMLGKPFPESGKPILSKLYKGVKISEERRLRMIGKKQSEDTKKKKNALIKLALNSRSKEKLEATRQKRKKLNDTQMKEILIKLENKQSMYSLAKEYKINYNTMIKYIKEQK